MKKLITVGKVLLQGFVLAAILTHSKGGFVSIDSLWILILVGLFTLNQVLWVKGDSSLATIKITTEINKSKE
ncbi:hypothetical protein [Exiguobacterium sp. s133]|uniref:hypothetical protein n=1 Tax=Exiguobacterium sp. s133 TaxID=2751213 RepID=UPI001BE83B90|nr:hypothetical protein [Exiguobacterium sp. s133]